MPFAIAAMLAYLGDPLVDRLETYGLSRIHAVLVVFTLALVLTLILLIPQLEYQVERFLSSLPAYADWLSQRVIPWVQQPLHLEVKTVPSHEIIGIVKNQWQNAGGHCRQYHGVDFPFERRISRLAVESAADSGGHILSAEGLG